MTCYGLIWVYWSGRNISLQGDSRRNLPNPHIASAAALYGSMKALPLASRGAHGAFVARPEKRFHGRLSHAGIVRSTSPIQLTRPAALVIARLAFLPDGRMLGISAPGIPRPMERNAMDDNGYLSRNRPYLAAMQRQRRARMVRIDYMPGKAARDTIEAVLAQSRPGTASATNSAVIDTIVAEWAQLTGLKKSEVDKPMTSAIPAGFSDQYARARITSDGLAKCAHAQAGASPAVPEFLPAYARANKSGLCHAKRAPAHANNSGSVSAGANLARVICGARRRRDGQPCQGLSVPGKQRCKWHGGASTGPKTDAGWARSLANLRQYRKCEP